MPKITFSFSGWVRNAPVERALEVATGNEIDVSQMSSEELMAKLEAGELAISFAEAYGNSSDVDIEIGDYSAEEAEYEVEED